jgi:N-acetyltransferase
MTRLIDPVVLEDGILRLEPFEPRHREPLRQAGDDPDLWRFHFLNLHNATFDRYFDHYLRETEAGRESAHVIIDKASGAIAGSSTYMAVVPAHRRLEIGSTWYAKPFPAAKRLLIGHVLDGLGWNRVEFKLDARNARSWAAMRKLGAHEEGIHKAHMVLPDGHVRDSVWFSVTRDNWPVVKAALDARLAARG